MKQILVLNTLEKDVSGQINTFIPEQEGEVEIVNTSHMKIAHCIGCNQCWLKTPGVCAIKDDYEAIIRKLVDVQNLWIVSDTRFGFLDYRGKRVLDRIMPMLNMYVEFRNGSLRHQLRYHPLDVGLIYNGDGDRQLLEEWCERTAVNLGGHSLGVLTLNEHETESLKFKSLKFKSSKFKRKEETPCM